MSQTIKAGPGAAESHKIPTSNLYREVKSMKVKYSHDPTTQRTPTDYLNAGPRRIPQLSRPVEPLLEPGSIPTRTNPWTMPPTRSNTPYPSSRRSTGWPATRRNLRHQKGPSPLRPTAPRWRDPSPGSAPSATPSTIWWRQATPNLDNDYHPTRPSPPAPNCCANWPVWPSR